MAIFNTDDYTLEELEEMFDSYYHYTDDHSVYTKHSAIEEAIYQRKKELEEKNV